jgi:hypothetical protein
MDDGSWVAVVLAQVSFEGPEALVAPWLLSERHYKTVSFSRSVSAA